MGAAKTKKPTGQSDAERLQKNKEGAVAVTCAICGQGFGKTARLPVLVEHYENKHEAKKMHTRAQCFPNTVFE
eukprot:GDKH01016538.1.p2 GENE.GDKH01016538.1~~GDKH01016538.1.p2  ORF type:complete len:73 (-),score=23.24 GDKH01016538.1:72-290(-)